jgi:hypothetical protein
VNKKYPETPQTETPAAEDKSILEPIMHDLKGQTRLPTEDELDVPEPASPGLPPQPAELDQDPGGGYNPDGTYPQT